MYVGNCPLCKNTASAIKGHLLICSACDAKWWSWEAVKQIGSKKEWAIYFAQEAGVFSDDYTEPCYSMYVIAFEPHETKSFYVGQTVHTVEHRFLQHKRGYIPGKGVEKRGLALVEWEGPMTKEESLVREDERANELRCKGFKVFGGH